MLIRKNDTLLWVCTAFDTHNSSVAAAVVALHKYLHVLNAFDVFALYLFYFCSTAFCPFGLI